MTKEEASKVLGTFLGMPGGLEPGAVLGLDKDQVSGEWKCNGGGRGSSVVAR